MKYLDHDKLFPQILTKEQPYYIPNAVYWHHGISNKIGDAYINDIIKSVNNEDIEILKRIINELLGINSIFESPYQTSEKVPYFYLTDDRNFSASVYNSKMNIIRTCVISADRIISAMEEDNPNFIFDENNQEIKEILDNKIYKEKEYTINISKFNKIVNLERYNKQIEIVNNCERTTIINAPAGFGKTMIGILWGIKNNKKIIWVLPRNQVSHSIYKSIVEDIKLLGLDITVELYLTGNTVERNHNSNEEFSSDIIVTNIDNFLAISYHDKLANRLFLINSANIIFDEYHEFVSSDAYFSCFINIMVSRNKYTNSKTILLSATPYDISRFWDDLNEKPKNKTKILPEKDKHYNAAHNFKYKIIVSENFIHKDIPNELTAVNSIFESQLLKRHSPNSELLHSSFTDDVIKEKMNKIYNDFSKYANGKEKNYGLIGALMVKASLDISFKNLNTSITSPQDDLQKIGRCNRFGEYENNSTLTFFKLPDSNNRNKFSQSELYVIKMFYSSKLADIWFETLKKYNGVFLSLNELYGVFNKFNLENKKEIEKIIDDKYKCSLKLLSENAYPFKMVEKSNKEIISAGGNKLRSNESEIFYIAKIRNENEYTGIFNSSFIFDNDDDEDSDEKTLKILLKVMKQIMDGENIMNLDYSEILNKKNDKKMKTKKFFEEIKNAAKKSNTPYIKFNELYDPNLGLVNNRHINRLF